MTEQSLAQKVHASIAAAGGCLSFESFMQQALYEPEQGYYQSAEVFGSQGDYITAVDMGPALVLGLTDALYWGWQRLGCPASWSLIEQGGGHGGLLSAVCKALDERSCMPTQVIAVEVSAALKLRQQQAYEALALPVQFATSLAELPVQDTAMLFCNELFDAFPVRCFQKQHDALYERMVVSKGDGFAWQCAEQALQEPLAIDMELQQQWPNAYVSEWNPGLSVWMRQLARVMPRGYAFCVDYGYSQQEYYRPQRQEGSLMAHYQHQVSDDLFAHIGQQDLTAHVDFTAWFRAAQQQGLQAVSFMSQGAWLAQSPSVQQFIVQQSQLGTAESVKQLAYLKRLMMPFAMGESFKFAVLSAAMPVDAPDYLRDFDHLSNLRLA